MTIYQGKYHGYFSVSPAHTGACIGPIGTMASLQTFTKTIQAMVIIICKTITTCMIKSMQSMTTTTKSMPGLDTCTK